MFILNMATNNSEIITFEISIKIIIQLMLNLFSTWFYNANQLWLVKGLLEIKQNVSLFHPFCQRKPRHSDKCLHKPKHMFSILEEI